MKTKLELAVLKYIESYYRMLEFKDLNFYEMSKRALSFFDARKALNIPSKLYKFRACNSQNFRTLNQNCIWMPKAKDFVDISDCGTAVKFDFKKMMVDKSATQEGYLDCVRTLGKCLDIVDVSSDDLQNVVSFIDEYQREVTIENHREMLSGIIDKEREATYFEWIEFFHDKQLDCISKFKPKLFVSDETREIIHVYSMTSIMDNNLLWENYAGKYTGFCIEYTIPEDSFFDDAKLLQLFPVIYKSKIPFIEATDFNVDEINEETLKWFRKSYGSSLMMQMLYKRMDYKFEHEWRMIGVGLETPLQPFPYISRIIAGKDIKPGNLQRLHKIAKNLGVPITRQVFDSSGNRFKYEQE